MIYFAYAMAWISTSMAAIAGLYFTHNPWCLLVLLIPATIRIRRDTWQPSESWAVCVMVILNSYIPPLEYNHFHVQHLY